MDKKQEKELKRTAQKMNMSDMLRAAEQNEFRMITVIGFLNKLAMLTTQENGFRYLSEVMEELKNSTEEELAAYTTHYIVVHDDARVTEGDTEGYPVISSIAKGEDGKLNIEYADTAFGGSMIHFRAIKEDNELFVTMFCEDSDKTILVADGEWFTI